MNKQHILTFLLVMFWMAACTPRPPSIPVSETPAPAEVLPTSAARTPLVVFAAGSLIIPFDALEDAFEARYPQIDVQAEYHGSIQVIRHATELHKPIDVVATADAALLPMLMYAVNNPDTGQPYANWYIRFASNHLALGSAYASSVVGGTEMTQEELAAAGLNRSTTHVDFMIGSADMNIDGIRKDGSVMPIFRNGDWAF